MSDEVKLVSKVLVLDSDPACHERIKYFCDANNLIGLKVRPDNVMSVLRSNVDLGGILLSESYAGNAHGGIQMASRIHAIRSELPIFLRRDSVDSLDGIDLLDQKALSAVYTIDTIDKLQPIVGEYIFSLSYPNVLVRGISEITLAALASQFKGLKVEVAPPYIVHDRLIYGEIFTLIPIESHWCRGYMMLQSEEFALLDLVKAERTHISSAGGANFRNLDGLLGEITNLVWGAFKNRYMSDNSRSAHLSQVPIIINHLHRYISFGTDSPQLCFRYTLSDPARVWTGTLEMYQKFVFNLSWLPEDFAENPVSVANLVESGELDLF